jgi:hypothetical protein
MARIFRFTPKRRSALRKATAASARKRRGGMKAKDGFGPYIRQGVRWLANAPTAGQASTISNFIEGKKNNRPSKLSRLYRDRSGKRRKRR